LDRLPRESAVAILRLRSLGDCVLTTPALDILQRARPDLRIAVMVEDRFREIFEGLVPTLPPTLSALRSWRPLLCLNLHGGTRSAWLTALSGARWRAGFGHFRQQFAYNVRIPRAQEILRVERTVHTAEHLASAMFYLGAPARETPRARLAAMPASGERPGPRAIVHAFAATPEKTWRADGFLAVAAHLKGAGIEPVFIGAKEDDLSPFGEYRVIQGASLSEIKSLLASASLFVGNDSGPAHMAAAFGIPVVVIFGASDPAIWGPWRTPSEVITAPGGITRVEAPQVMEALTRLRVAA
jgi:lipopolysaccharide heptosyltransferase III